MISFGIIAGLVAMAGWGTADFILKRPAQKMGPLQLVFIIQIIGFTLTLPILLIAPLHPELTIKVIVLLIMCGAVDLFAYFNFLKGISVGELFCCNTYQFCVCRAHSHPGCAFLGRNT